MSRYREIVCKYYVAFGICQKSQRAQMQGQCRGCEKYVPKLEEGCKTWQGFYIIERKRMSRLNRKAGSTLWTAGR